MTFLIKHCLLCFKRKIRLLHFMWKIWVVLAYVEVPTTTILVCSKRLPDRYYAVAKVFWVDFCSHKNVFCTNIRSNFLMRFVCLDQCIKISKWAEQKKQNSQVTLVKGWSNYTFCSVDFQALHFAAFQSSSLVNSYLWVCITWRHEERYITS